MSFVGDWANFFASAIGYEYALALNSSGNIHAHTSIVLRRHLSTLRTYVARNRGTPNIFCCALAPREAMSSRECPYV